MNNRSLLLCFAPLKTYNLKTMTLLTPYFFWLVVFLNLVLSVTALADPNKTALLIGGSGEDFSTNNFFTDGFTTYQETLKSRDWNVQTLFDGEKGAIGNSKPATNANIDSALEKIVASAQSGDEVLLYVNAHGLEHQLGAERTHHIFTEDQDGYSVDKLQEAADSLAKKGVKVALVDLSCYSGTTQSVGGSKGLVKDWKAEKKAREQAKKDLNYCIATLAANTYVSVCGMTPKGTLGFTNTFVNLPKKGSFNMEEQFLAARAHDESAGDLPELSTLNYPITGRWSRFLNTFDPEQVHRDEFFKHLDDKEIETEGHFVSELNTAGACKMSNEISSEIDKLVKNLDQAKGKLLEPFEKNITDEVNKLPGITAKLDPIYHRILSYFGKNINWGEGLPNLSVAEMNEILKAIESGIDLKSVAWLDDHTKSIIETIRPHAKEIREQKKTLLAGIEQDWKDYEAAKKQIEEQSAIVMKAERAFYNKYAEVNSKQDNNPCRDFQL